MQKSVRCPFFFIFFKLFATGNPDRLYLLQYSYLSSMNPGSGVRHERDVESDAIAASASGDVSRNYGRRHSHSSGNRKKKSNLLKGALIGG